MEFVDQIHDVTYFATARITDILIGSAIGLIGTYIIGRRSASSRLPDLIVKLIRSQARVLVGLATNNKENNSDNTKWIKEKMGINLMNFKTAYNTALGEIPHNEEMLEMISYENSGFGILRFLSTMKILRFLWVILLLILQRYLFSRYITLINRTTIYCIRILSSNEYIVVFIYCAEDIVLLSFYLFRNFEKIKLEKFSSLR